MVALVRKMLVFTNLFISLTVKMALQTAFLNGLIDHQYTMPWLHLIKEEMDKIKRGSSDINPYAVTNNAEFLAVVSEYFFSDPEEFHQKHGELYSFMSDFYDQKLSN